MFINASYNSFNTDINKAIITSVASDINGNRFEITATEGDELQPSEITLKAVGVDTLAGEFSITMNLEQMRQFNLLIAQFASQMA